MVAEPCPSCKGAGTVEKEREFEVDDPARHRGRLDPAAWPGQGEPGRRGGRPGDLNVMVRVRPHPIFRREGDVVTCDVPVSMAQAALGAVVEVPTLDGTVEMRVPPGTQSGRVFRLRGKGAGREGGRARRRARAA